MVTQEEKKRAVVAENDFYSGKTSELVRIHNPAIIVGTYFSSLTGQNSIPVYSGLSSLPGILAIIFSTMALVCDFAQYFRQYYVWDGHKKHVETLLHNDKGADFEAQVDESKFHLAEDFFKAKAWLTFLSTITFLIHVLVKVGGFK
jgi:hypothetical protein